MEKRKVMQSERDIRLEKIEKMKKNGINPYPSKFSYTHKIKEAKKEQEKETVIISGRIMTIREMGGLIFANLKDSSDTMQLVLEKKLLKDKKYHNTEIDIFTFLKSFVISLILLVSKEKSLPLKKENYQF